MATIPLDQLYADRIPYDEWRIILQSVYKHSQISHDRPREIVLSRSQESVPELTLIHNAEGKLYKIEHGKEFGSVQLEEIKKEIQNAGLLAAPEIKISRAILFSLVRLDHYWRYKDEFQISPAPTNAPQPPFTFGRSSFILEFKYASSSHHLINIHRSEKRRRELALVLNVFLEGSITELSSGSTQYHWVGVPSANQVQTMYCQDYYSIDDFSVTVPEFELIAGEQIKSIEPDKYFNRNGIELASLSIPTNLDQLFNRYFSLSKDDSDRFLSACYWYRHSDLVFPLSHAASFASLIVAIESLIPNDDVQKCPACQLPINDENYPKCNECERPKFGGSTGKFREFLGRYAPRLEKPQKTDLYNIRSKVFHEGLRFKRDSMDGLWTLGPENKTESDRFTLAQIAARITLINWLIANEPEPIESPASRFNLNS